MPVSQVPVDVGGILAFPGCAHRRVVPRRSCQSHKVIVVFVASNRVESLFFDVGYSPTMIFIILLILSSGEKTAFVPEPSTRPAGKLDLCFLAMNIYNPVQLSRPL